MPKPGNTREATQASNLYRTTLPNSVGGSVPDAAPAPVMGSASLLAGLLLALSFLIKIIAP
jgi:hypothetical protein